MIVTKVQGGLGNQLFQYAAALHLSIITKLPLVVDLSFFNEEKFSNLCRLDKFKIDYSEINIDIKQLKEFSLANKVRNYLFRNTSIISNPGVDIINGDLLKYPIKSLTRLNKKKDFILIGWLQNEVFFSKVSHLLSENLWLKEKQEVDQEIASLITKRNSVAVHIRRGDMSVNPNFVTLQSKYYFDAVRRIMEYISDPCFFIFSDEPDKAQELLIPIDVPKVFITKQSQSLGYYGTKGDYIDFELMRLCKHYITANSTFSWWPAYLSSNSEKIVVTPKIWYENKLLQTNFEKSGLLPNTWIKI